MMKRSLWIVLLTLFSASIVQAVKPEPPNKGLTPVLSVAIVNFHLILRIIVGNDGDTGAVIFDPFVNETRLLIRSTAIEIQIENNQS